LIENIDQRVTIDIERFCEDLANLYTSLFKPILDIVLNAARLSRVMGARGPVIIAGYYLVLGQVKMRLMPDFKKLTMLQSELEGDYRTAHSRLITNSEEISFFDGASREKSILTGMFDKLYKHIAAFSEKKAWIGVIDQYLIKYGSSVVGYALMALPIFFPVDGDTSNRTVGDNTRDFVRNRQLLMDLAGAIGTLLQTVNKVATLAGSTSRVGEVLDSVNDIRNNGSAPFVVRTDAPITTAVSPSSPTAADDEKNRDKAALAAAHASQEAFLVAWRDLGDKLRASRLQAAREQQHSTNGELVTVKNGGGLMAVGETIEFRDASIVSPDGRLLVEHLSVSVPRGVNVMVTGPNGCGKSSLFRILGELWPLHSGLMIKPGKEDIMFVPQKPYQVIGTLRDQLIYPHSVAQMKALGVSDEDLINLLRVVDPASGILSQWNLDETRNWINAFSGGQKQRVAMARVFYHRPRYAILDECTSAVSDEVESIIYTTCRKLGITIFTVSHRAQLQQYHDQQLRYDGRGGWEFLDSESVAKRQKEAALSA
jgi:ATP-binding cassette subfamily D (ALD) protein 3